MYLLFYFFAGYGQGTRLKNEMNEKLRIHISDYFLQ